MTEVRALFRLIGRNRLSSIAAVAMLAVSIAGAATTFALIDAVLWRALPYRDPARLAVLVTTHAGGQANVSLPDFTAIRERAKDFEVAGAGGFTSEYALTGFGEPRQLRGRLLSGDYFRTLGVRLAAGRDFTRTEEQAGAGTVAIITDSLRQQIFSGREPVGQLLSLNGRGYTVVGVLPPYRDPFGDVDIYVPHQFSPTLPRRFRMLTPIVRLGADRDLASLQSQIRVVTALPDPEAAGHTVQAFSLSDHQASTTRGSVQLLFGAAAGLLAIGLVNFAMLLGARARDRQSEFAVRTALGATRMRLLKLTLMDATTLSVGGVVTALAVSRVLLPIVQARYGSDTINAVGLNTRVVAFAAVIGAIAIVTAVLTTAGSFGARISTQRYATRQTSAASFGETGRVLIVVQIAVSMALVVSAAVLVRSFLELRQVDPGFRTVDILASRIALPVGKYSTPAARAQFWRTLIDGLRAHSVRAAISTQLPLTGQDNPTAFYARLTDGSTITTKLRSVSPAYFDVMRIPLVNGRGLADTDTADAPLALLVNQRLAVALSRVGPALGQTISFDVAATPLVGRVVGIVGDIRHEGLHRDPGPEAYAAFEQAPIQTYSLVMESRGNQADASRLLRETIADIDRDQPVTGPVLMSQYVEQSLAGTRFQAGVLSFFAWTALVAAATGLYGFLTYIVRGRRREWAVRLALGATSRDLQRLVLGETGLSIASGVVLGLTLFAIAAGLLKALVFGVVIWNPAVVAASVIILTTACLCAATVPAWRAGRIAPSEALRE
jgi:putative ABC transport system permease protein